MQTAIHLLIEDSDERSCLADAFAAVGAQVHSHSSVGQLLGTGRAGALGCIVADLDNAEMQRWELKHEITAHGIDMPIFFLTDNRNILSVAKLLNQGGVDFLPRPPESQVLMERVSVTLEEQRRRYEQESEHREMECRVSRLTPRETEVNILIVQGLCNKEISNALGISVRTVEKHRAAVMEKLGANNVAQLCRIGQQCERVFRSWQRVNRKQP